MTQDHLSGKAAREAAFQHEFAERLQTAISARKLADESGYARTTVTNIHQGRAMPTQDQVRDLLQTVQADPQEIDHWLDRYDHVLRPRVDLAPAPAPLTEPSRRRSRLRTGLLVGGSLLAAVGVGTGAWAALNRPDPPTPVAGEVRCASGAAVVGVWITASNGSGAFATTRPGPQNLTYYNGTTNLDAYRVNVGCGGTPSQWRAESRSPDLTGPYQALICDDSPEAVSVAPYFGRCKPVSSS